MERWKRVVGAPGYWVSDAGRVRRRGRVLKPRISSKTGYCEVTLQINGKPSYRLVHRLALEAFVGPCPPGCETRHGNDDRTANRLSNLEWGTRKENHQDKVDRQRLAVGSKHTSARLSEADVLEIRKKPAPTRVLAKRYGVSQRTIMSVQHGETWRHV